LAALLCVAVIRAGRSNEARYLRFLAAIGPCYHGPMTIVGHVKRKPRTLYYVDAAGALHETAAKGGGKRKAKAPAKRAAARTPAKRATALNRYYDVHNYHDSGGISHRAEFRTPEAAIKQARETPRSSIEVVDEGGSIIHTVIFSPKHPPTLAALRRHKYRAAR